MSWAPPEAAETEAPDWAPPEAQGWTPPEAAQPTPLSPEQMTTLGAQIERDESQRAVISRGMESGTEFLTEVAGDPVGAVKAIPEIVMGAMTAPGRLAYDAAADVVAQIPDFRVEEDGSVTKLDNRREFGGNLRGGMTGEDKPVDKFLGRVAETNPKLATAGFIGRDLTAMAPLAAIGMLPALAAQLVTAGFTVDMIRHAPALFEEYADEINKPAAERNAGKISELESGIAQTFVFAPLAGAHATRGVPEQFRVAFDNARRNAPGSVPRAARDIASQREAIYPDRPAEEGAPVPDWAPPEARISPTPETTPAPIPAEPSRPAHTTQAASQPGVGELSADASRVTPQAAAVSPEAAAANLTAQVGSGVRPIQSKEILHKQIRTAHGSRYYDVLRDGVRYRVRIADHFKQTESGDVARAASLRDADLAARTGIEYPVEIFIKTAEPLAREADAMRLIAAAIEPFRGKTLDELYEIKAQDNVAPGVDYWGDAKIIADAANLETPRAADVRSSGQRPSVSVKTPQAESRSAIGQTGSAALQPTAVSVSETPTLRREAGATSPQPAATVKSQSEIAKAGASPGLPPAPKPAEAGSTPGTGSTEVTQRHLKEARQALALEERPPDIFDVIERHYRGAVKFPEADFKDVVAKARGTAKQRMSVKDGEPADNVLKALALENRKYAEWTADDLAQAMLTAGETRIGQRQPSKAKVQQLAEEMARAEKEQVITDWDQAAAATRAEQNALLVGVGGSSLAASKTPGTVSFPVLLGGIDAIRPMEMPELLRLTRDFAGSEVAVRRLRGHLRGYAKGRDITLNEKLFADPQQLAMTMAHEIGHVVDFMPEGTLKRGNLLGRLIGSTSKFLAGNHGWLRNAKLREEVKALSAYWRPWNEALASKTEKAYRNSGKELYADALSVLLNSPGLLEQKAPTFYKAFFDHLDKKPRFKQEFFALQDLLNRGPEAVLGERLAQSREAFEKGEAVLHEKILERQAARNSFKDFLTKVRIQSVDIADFVKRRLGSKDPRHATEFDRLYEEWKLNDNKNAADVQRIYHDMIQPVVKAGLDEHTFGQVLELQRIRGGLDAYRDMQTMRKALGPDRMGILQKASETLTELERKGVAEELAIEQVALPLERAGIPFEMIDTYRQLRETQGTRAELANPQGRSPIMAEAELGQLLGSVTPEQRAVLEQAAAKFRGLVFERATEAAEVGIINKLTFEKTVVPNKNTYAAFRPLDKIEPYVPAAVRRARGTLKDIENPFITTLLKLQSLNNLIELQRVKNVVRDQMQQLFPADFVKAPTRWTGRGHEAMPAKAGAGRVDILENGRRVSYDTDPYIAKMFEQLTPVDSFWMNKLLEVPFRMGIYPLIIKYNPGFLFAFNPLRDLARSIRNLYAVEGVPRREMLPNYASKEVLGAVSDYLAGRPNPLAEAMIRNKAITQSWQGFSRFDQQDVMTDLLRRYKLAGTPHRNAAIRTLLWLPEKINHGGSFLEALPKFAAYKTLINRGVGQDRASFLVRNYVGTPNFKIKGQWGSVQNSWLPFINIFTQGWRADLKLATSPKTAGGWWMQWALQHGWQATMVGLATAGIFGDEIKQLYAGISEYDRTNYGTLPLGKQMGKGEFGQKTVYLRFPRDETSRFFSALTYKATRSIADKIMGNAPHQEGLPTEVFAFGAGVTPSPTPVLNVAGAWKDYMAGQNPIDPFRNRPVIGGREFAAGGVPALGDMATWTLNQSGALNLFRWNPRSETTTELTVSAVPIVNRLLKISDQGYREDQMNSEKLDAKAKAQLRVNYNEAAQSLVARHHWLQSLGEKRTIEQHQLYARIHAWKTQFYDPADEAAWNLREDKGQQRQIVEEINRAAERMQRELKAQ